MNTTEQERFEAFLASIAAMPVEKKVKLYVKTREAKSQGQKAWDVQEAQYKRLMEHIEHMLLKDADEKGVLGFKTEYGTTYTDETVKLSIADDTAFEAFLRTQEHPFLFFERRIAVGHVKNYMTATEGVLPPGLNAFRERVMRIRKATEK
jgi:hypothetical protein